MHIQGLPNRTFCKNKLLNMFNALIDAIGVQNYKQQVLDIATTNIALYTADGTILKRLGVEAMFRSDVP